MNPSGFFKCLSDDTRYQIIMLIFKHQQLCVCEFTEILDLSQPKISRHLAQLRNCGVLSDHREGRWVYYRLSETLPSWCTAIIKETYVGNQDELESLMNKQPSQTNCN